MILFNTAQQKVGRENSIRESFLNWIFDEEKNTEYF